jgi:hypoxanthine phosphoribosyltransferase
MSFLPALLALLERGLSFLTATTEISSYLLSRRISAAPEFGPLRIRGPISFSNLQEANKRVVRLLDAERFRPDAVVGVNYTGLSHAALLAQELYVPVLHAAVKYGSPDGYRICTSVRFNFSPHSLRNKRVLLVDNRIDTGNTMAMVRKRLLSTTAECKTLVFYRDASNGSVLNPDLVLFTSKRPLKGLLR